MEVIANTLLTTPMSPVLDLGEVLLREQPFQTTNILSCQSKYSKSQTPKRKKAKCFKHFNNANE